MLALPAGPLRGQQVVRLHGTVRDAATGGPLAGAVISAGGRLAYTDGRGRFLLGGVPDSAAVLVTRVG